MRLIKQILPLCAAVCSINAAATDYCQYVSPLVGTAASETKAAGMYGKGSEEFGQTLPAVLEPRGMNFWTPQTRDTELKCIAPYYYADSLLQGFRNSHWIVGGCTQDYGSCTIMPIFGNLRCQPEERASRFSHSQECATQYYYSVSLPDEGITASLTGTSRAAIMQIAFERDGKAYIVINPNSDEGQGKVEIDATHGMVSVANPVHRIYQGKGQPAGYSGYAVIIPDKPFSGYGTYDGGNVSQGASSLADKPEMGCYLEYDVCRGDTLTLRIGTSFTSPEGALLNLNAEIPHNDFNQVKDQLHDIWNQHLGRIHVDSDNDDELRKFYTAMYHASFLPHAINDVDGKYPAFASGTPIMTLPEGETAYYDDYSMWDTYRALHPLLTLLYPSQSGEMMQSLVHKYEQGGWMPIFPCWNSYTAAMIGDHAAAAIADAYCKGVRNFDAEKAYEGLRRNAFEIPPTQEYLDGKGRRALPSYLQYGYIPLEDSVPDAYHKKEQVSRTLEYAFDDFCLAQLAKALRHDGDHNELIIRSGNYRNVINPAKGYADGRYADGHFAGDDPYGFTKHITEGAPCHYTWYAPHDPESLIKALGGKEAFEAKLDSMFACRRYWHGNEPCHQIAFMYDFIGEQPKAAKEVRHILDTEYLDCPGGLSGNDDAGQMSAWYVFAALGFYPVCPATPYYAISCPTFKKAVIQLENGNTATFLAPNASPENTRIRAIKHNGKVTDSPFLNHFDLLEGGTWEFELEKQ